MKGPSLQYDLRVLRIFCCDGCGRQVQSPGHLTTHTCACSHPPRFMRPLERPVTVSPDITAFLSPPDPAEPIEENLPDEEPYVPYIPNLPPRPVRFPGHRKLTDDIENFQPTEFDTGVEPPTASASSEVPNFTPQSVVSNVSPATQDPPRRGNRPDRSERHDRRESRRERSQSGGRSGALDDLPLVTEQPVIARGGTAVGPVDTPADQNLHALDRVDESEASDETDAVPSDQSTNTGASGEPRRRHRRRGRRKGRGQGSGGGEA